MAKEEIKGSEERATKLAQQHTMALSAKRRREKSDHGKKRTWSPGRAVKTREKSDNGKKRTWSPARAVKIRRTKPGAIVVGPQSAKHDRRLCVSCRVISHLCVHCESILGSCLFRVRTRCNPSWTASKQASRIPYTHTVATPRSVLSHLACPTCRSSFGTLSPSPRISMSL